MRGPLDLGMRLEYLFAMSDYRMHGLIRMLAQVLGGKPEEMPPFSRFIRFHDLQEPAAELEAIAKKLGVPYEVRENKHSKWARTKAS